MKVPQKVEPEGFITFKVMLLRKLQHEFEKNKAEALDLQECQKAIDKAATVSHSQNVQDFDNIKDGWKLMTISVVSLINEMLKV